VIDVCATVEDDFLDAGLDRALGNQLADCGRCSNIGTGLEVLRAVLFQRRGSGKRAACRIVDDLNIDVLRRAMSPTGADGRWPPP
jgi:hypothetical protein